MSGAITPNKKPKPEPKEVELVVEQSATDRILARVREAKIGYKELTGYDIKPPTVDIEISETFTETSDGKLLYTDGDSRRSVEAKIRFRMEPNLKKEGDV